MKSGEIEKDLNRCSFLGQPPSNFQTQLVSLLGHLASNLHIESGKCPKLGWHLPGGLAGISPRRTPTNLCKHQKWEFLV